MVTVRIDVPVLERLDIDGDRVVRRVAAWVAARIRTRVRQHHNATGEMWRSVKPSRVKRGSGRSVVSPKGFRSDDKKPHALVLRSRQKRDASALLALTPEQDAQTGEVATKEIARQLSKSRRGGIVSRVRRLR